MCAKRRNNIWRLLNATVLLFCILAVPAAVAKQQIITTSAARDVLTLAEAALLLRVPAVELKRLAQLKEVPGRHLAGSWRFNRQALLAWLNGEWSMIATAVPSATSMSPVAMKEIRGGATKKSPKRIPPTRDDEKLDIVVEQEKGIIGEAPEERTAEDAFLRGQKVLLAPGEIAVDTGLFYSQTNGLQLANVNGGVGLATVEQGTFTTLLQARLGVGSETELFAATTFSHQYNDVFFGGLNILSSGRTEFGDVHLGIRHTLLNEGVGFPSIIATIDGRIPTGQTSYAIGGGFAFVKSIDPVVLFANANYRYTFSRDFADVTRLEPKHRIDATVGYAFAINDTLTLSSSVSGVFTGTTNFSGADLRQQNNFSLNFGVTSWLAKGLYIEPSVSFGLGGPSDSFSVGITMPYTF